MSRHGLAQFLNQHLQQRLDRVRDRMGKGLPDDEYREAVGQDKEIRALMRDVPELIKQLDGDDDEAESDETESEGRDSQSREAGARARRTPARRNGNRGRV